MYVYYFSECAWNLTLSDSSNWALIDMFCLSKLSKNIIIIYIFFFFIECARNLTLPDTSTVASLQSPNYPRNYSLNLRCRYIIAAPENTTIVVKVKSGDGSSRSPNTYTCKP